jgi:hypothetical protein
MGGADVSAILISSTMYNSLAVRQVVLIIHLKGWESIIF